MYCPKCGKEIRQGAKFCPACGAKIEAVQQSKRPAPEPARPKIQMVDIHEPAQKPGRRSGAQIAIVTLSVLLLILLLCLGGLAAYTMGAFDAFLPGRQSEVSAEREKEDEREEEQEKRNKKKKEETEEDDGEETTQESSSREETQPGALTPPQPIVAETIAGAVPTAAAMAPTQAMPVPNQQMGLPTVPVTGAMDYILPDSSSRLLTAVDLAGLTKEQLRYARNEIYARHGRMFSDSALQDYFNTKTWYRGTISAASFTENMLSQIEKDNIKYIKQIEDAMP